MQNNFEFDDISTRAYNYLKDQLSYQYVTIRHYRSRWRPVKEYMDRRNLESINVQVCKSFLLELYKGRCHAELTENEKLIEKSVLVLSEFIETGFFNPKGKVRYLDGTIGRFLK